MKRIISFFFTGAFLIVSCAPSKSIAPIIPTVLFTPKPTRTHSPSQTPTGTPSGAYTLVPTKTNIPMATLTSHSWKPSPILITYNRDRDSFCGTICPPDPAPFILYGDGNFFLHTSVDINGNKHFRYLHKKLDQNGICRILNTIDQTGFLDFDPSTYLAPKIYDAVNWRIKIYAWKSKDVELYGLGEMANELKYDPSLIPSNLIHPSSLRDTFTLLYNYPTDELDLYTPQRLVIWLWKSSFAFSYTRAWTVDNISLANLYKRGGSVVDAMPRPVYLDGKNAKNVYAMLDNFNYYGEVTQNGESYGIYVRPALPFETISKDVSAISPKTSQMKLPPSWHCDSSDGTMPIPSYGPR